MAKYYISYNDYLGYCVIEEIKGTGTIVEHYKPKRPALDCQHHELIPLC